MLVELLKIARKVTKTLGILLWDNLLQKLVKLDQSGHAASDSAHTWLLYDPCGQNYCFYFRTWKQRQCLIPNVLSVHLKDTSGQFLVLYTWSFVIISLCSSNKLPVCSASWNVVFVVPDIQINKEQFVIDRKFHKWVSTLSRCHKQISMQHWNKALWLNVFKIWLGANILHTFNRWKCHCTYSL